MRFQNAIKPGFAHLLRLVNLLATALAIVGKL